MKNISVVRTLLFRNINSSSFFLASLDQAHYCEAILSGLLSNSNVIIVWSWLQILKDKAKSLKGAIFHTMAIKLSLEVNNYRITISTKKSCLKILYNIFKIKKKHRNFEQYDQLLLDGPQNCHLWNSLIYGFRPKLIFYYQRRKLYSCTRRSLWRFQKRMLHFGYAQNIELYNPQLNERKHLLSLLLFLYLAFIHLFLMTVVQQLVHFLQTSIHTDLSQLWCTFASINSIGYHNPSSFTSHPRVTGHWSSPSSLDFNNRHWSFESLVFIVTAIQHYHWSSWSLVFSIVTRLLHRHWSTLSSREAIHGTNFQLQYFKH